MSDAEELAGYVDVWKRATEDFVRLMADVPESEWSTPTDLPGWTVHDQVAHIAHLEALLAGAPHDEVQIGEPEHVRSPMGTFTEQGVMARKDRTAADLIDEIRSSTAARHAELLANPVTDGAETAPGLFGAIGWNQRTLLRNRPLDVWMHEQDVRRAVGREGNLDSPAGKHVVTYLLEALGVVVAKRAGAPAGTSVVVEVVDHGTVAVEVGDDGRASFVDAPTEPTVRLSMPFNSYVVLAGGRRTPADVDVTVSGDRDLAQAILASLAVTP